MERRAPALNGASIEAVETSMHDVVERLLLAGLHAHPEIADKVGVLFELAGPAPSTGLRSRA